MEGDNNRVYIDRVIQVNKTQVIVINITSPTMDYGNCSVKWQPGRWEECPPVEYKGTPAGECDINDL